MKVSLKWIKEFTNVELDDAALIERIGEQLGAVEGSEDWGSYFDQKIVIADIVSAEDHPNADKLGKYTIITGSEQKKLIAGDKSLKAGDKVAYIPPGCAVPSSLKQGEAFVIEEREMRGEVSQGMLGSAAELLFSDNHEKVLVLDTDLPAGTSLKEAYKLDDIVIDIENKMFTHRPDCFGILGVAREVAGIQGIKFESPEWYTQAANNLKPESGNELKLTVQNEAEEEVRRLSAIALSGITIATSPLQLQSFLMRVGLRPINNVVDITNFVMHLTAQPLHAFDYDKVSALDESEEGAYLVARKPREGEKMTLLDGREIEPHEGAILISSKTKAMAVGGCMGGSETEVDENTKNIILEVANFDMYSIRRTSFKNGIFTDAVTRFNKGQSLEQIDKVVSYAVDMFKDNAGAKVASDYFDLYENRQESVAIETGVSFINSILGSELSGDQISKLLENVEMQVRVDGEKISVTPPFWRQDLHIPEDIVEEVGRLYGFNNLPMSLPPRSALPQYVSSELNTAREIRKLLARGGASEVLGYNFVSDKDFERSGLSDENAYRIRNALSPHLQFMRTHILPSVLEKAYPNIRKGNDEFALFELGKVHNKQFVEENLPAEQRRLAFIYTSKNKTESDGAPYYKARLYLDYLLEELNIEQVEYSANDGNHEHSFTDLGDVFDKSRSAKVMINGEQAGIIGECSASVLRAYKLPENTAVFEVDVTKVELNMNSKAEYKPLSKYPSVDVDITLKTPIDLGYQKLKAALDNAVKEQDVEAGIGLVGIYRPENEDSRNITFNIEFQSETKTLTKEEVNEMTASIVSKLEKELSVKQV